MEGVRSGMWTCSRCVRSQQRHASVSYSPAIASRFLSSTTPPRAGDHAGKTEGGDSEAEQEMGALSRRLSDMAEETMNTGSKSDRSMMQDAGFSNDLKKQLEERIAQTSFNAHDEQAASVANIPVRLLPYWNQNPALTSAALRWQRQSTHSGS